MPPAATKIRTLDAPIILLSALPLDHARGGGISYFFVPIMNERM